MVCVPFGALTRAARPVPWVAHQKQRLDSCTLVLVGVASMKTAIRRGFSKLTRVS
jgi:hypothetical protein